MIDAIPEPLRTILVGVAAVLAMLVTVANTHPNVGWLRPFRFEQNLSDAQVARSRRRHRLLVGIELIGLGLLLPVGYLVLTVMRFDDIDPLTLALAGAGSVLCIGLGVWAMRGRK